MYSDSHEAEFRFEMNLDLVSASLFLSLLLHGFSSHILCHGNVVISKRYCSSSALCLKKKHFLTWITSLYVAIPSDSKDT